MKQIITVLMIGFWGIVLIAVVTIGGLVWYSKSNELTPEQAAQLRTEAAKMPADHSFDVSRDSARPEAVALMKQDWFWDITDENSPFGNDDGADALAIFRRERKENPSTKSVNLARSVCERLEMPFDQWCQRSVESVKHDFGLTNFFSTRPGDQMIIAMALGELVDRGFVDSDLRKLGLQAIKNEQLPNVSKSWVDPKEREARLEVMKGVLISAPDHDPQQPK